MAYFDRRPLSAVLGTKGYIRGPFGSALVRRELSDHGIPVYEQQHAISGSREFRFFIDEDKFKELSRFQVQPYDLIISCSGTIGKISVIRQQDPLGIISQALLILRPNRDLILPEFLYYFLNTQDGKNALIQASHGSVQVNIAPRAVVEQIDMPVPALQEQRNIINILKTLDDKIELNHRMNHTLEAMARAIFKSWFVDFDPVRAKAEGRDPGLPPDIAALFPNSFEDSKLGESPKGWRVVSMKEIIEINPPRSLSKGTTAPYLDMANVPNNGARADKVVDRSFGSGTKFINGDTLLARITPCLENGKTAFVDFLQKEQIGWGSTEFIVLRPKPPLPPAFAYFLARDSDFRAFAISNMSGTSGRQRVPSDCFNSYKLVVPGDAIAAAFGKFTDAIMEQLKANDEQASTLAAMRDALLPKLLSGKIRIHEAN